VRGAQRDRAARVLPRRAADVGRLDPVVDRVAKEVRERVAEALGDRGVDLDVAVHDDQARQLAVRAREVAHRALVLPEPRRDRHHARAADRLLELGIEPLDLLDVVA
jgi:hypothetical protein